MDSNFLDYQNAPSMDTRGIQAALRESAAQPASKAIPSKSQSGQADALRRLAGLKADRARQDILDEGRGEGIITKWLRKGDREERADAARSSTFEMLMAENAADDYSNNRDFQQTLKENAIGDAAEDRRLNTREAGLNNRQQAGFSNELLERERVTYSDPATGQPMNLWQSSQGTTYDHEGNVIDVTGLDEYVRPVDQTREEALNLTPAEQAVDAAFASDYAEWVGGGSSDTTKLMSQMDDVVGYLESGNNITGSIIGLVPPELRSMFNEESVDSQQLLEEVVQRNLKAILGAQFARQEGEQLVARAYNPRLSEEKNLARVKRLQRQMEIGLQARQEMAKYYQENGTLKGFQGRVPTIHDFIGIDYDTPEAPQSQGGLTDAEEARRQELRARYNQ